MRKKIRVGVLFGGKSAEHEISIQSAKNIIVAINKNKYEVTPIGIDKEGKWHLLALDGFLDHFNSSNLMSFDPKDLTSQNILLMLSKKNDLHEKLDVIFPVLHGPLGEDGTVQGYLQLADIPFVGAGVVGSAVGMDKDVMKRLFRDAGIPMAKFLCYPFSSSFDFDEIADQLGVPFFVKPANLGSSVGIHKIKERKKFREAVDDAFRFDSKIVFEENVVGREIECAVLGNEHPIASLPGELIPQHEFYSYEAKYLDKKGAKFCLPAKLEPDVIAEIQRMAIKAFKVCCSEGMARVDFFLKGDKVILNEINTIPGFTQISMYPKMWEVSGLSYPALIDRLIELGLERAERYRKLQTSFSLPYTHDCNLISHLKLI